MSHAVSAINGLYRVRVDEIVDIVIVSRVWRKKVKVASKKIATVRKKVLEGEINRRE